MNFWKFMLKSQLARSGKYLDNTAKTVLRKKLSIIQFWVQDHTWFQNYSEAAVWTKKKKKGRQAQEPKKEEIEERQVPEPSRKQEEPANPWRKRTPVLGKKEKGRQASEPHPGPEPQTEPRATSKSWCKRTVFWEKKKGKGKKKRKAPNPQTQPAEVNK